MPEATTTADHTVNALGPRVSSTGHSVVAALDNLGELERTTHVRRREHTDEDTVVHHEGPPFRAFIAHPFEDTGERLARRSTTTRGRVISRLR